MRHDPYMVLAGNKAVLVPYQREHVERYHAWMQNSGLHDTLASDPLTLKDEYEMQERWTEDQSRCMFIIMDPVVPKKTTYSVNGGGMVGEITLLLKDEAFRHSAQIEVMIAELKSRRKGIASEALILGMLYAIQVLGRNVFIAKIGVKNTVSQNLFEKLGFKEQSRSSVFKEITFALEISEPVKKELLRTFPNEISVSNLHSFSVYF